MPRDEKMSQPGKMDPTKKPFGSNRIKYSLNLSPSACMVIALMAFVLLVNGQLWDALWGLYTAIFLVVGFRLFYTMVIVPMRRAGGAPLRFSGRGVRLQMDRIRTESIELANHFNGEPDDPHPFMFILLGVPNRDPFQENFVEKWVEFKHWKLFGHPFMGKAKKEQLMVPISSSHELVEFEEYCKGSLAQPVQERTQSMSNQTCSPHASSDHKLGSSV